MNGIWNRGAVMVLLLAPLLTMACGGEKNEEEGGPAPSSVPVRVAPVTARSFENYFHLLGTVRGQNEATLVFEVGGVIESILADKGSFVKQGAPIARLDADMYEAGAAEASAALAIAKETYDKSLNLREKGAISEIELSALEQQYEAAKARHRSASILQQDATLRAPFSGILDARYLDRGDYAAPQTPFGRLIDAREVKVEVPVPEIHLARVQSGDAATVVADQYPGREFAATVTFVSREVNASTRTVLVEVTTGNEEGLLRPGMTVRARLVKERFKDAIVVPQDAVLNGDQGASVFLEQDGLAVERPVVVSTVSDEMAVIESGLSVGDRLITRGARDLVNGERVEVLAN